MRDSSKRRAMRLSASDGEEAVAAAREAVDARARGSSPPKRPWRSPPFNEKRGVFVTLNSAGPAGEALRGCIGFPYPVMKLGDAITEAAGAAASEDPRFPPVAPYELSSVTVEVSVLTVPEALDPSKKRDYPSIVRVGEDGLVIRRGDRSGLLLPQVATEFGLGPREFLDEACVKAGLSPGAWLEGGTEVLVFQAEVFREAGKVPGRR